MQFVFVVCILLLVISRTGAHDQCAGTEDGEVCSCSTATGTCVNEVCQCMNAVRRQRNFLYPIQDRWGCFMDYECLARGLNCRCISNRCGGGWLGCINGETLYNY
ncbi:uncharacterized protein LOC123537196 [Mercenaria mercenaria]|uniref:uncharacterized protein LOC123537196 n=1 Tax=Mercenaria mercenaria TaxID=6596 RepID=UPI00234F93C6|nr:uncharacterized protein LOC123537196 [Mercenaria mercenaria]XP_053383659.1 uncharacterized protein LOC123537196 [Mercenaria mercenaria]